MGDKVLEKLVAEVMWLRRRVGALETLEGGGGSGGWPVALDPLLYCAYDGPRPFETDFSGNPHGHLGQIATVTGGVIFRPGRFGKAVQVAEGATNLLANPSVETNLDYWVFYNDGTNPIRERSAAAAWIGQYGYRWVLGADPTGTPYVYQPASVSPIQGQAYTFSMRVRARGSAIGKTVYAYISERRGATAKYGYGADTVLTGEWQTLTATHTVLQADCTGIWGQVRFRAGAAAGDELHLDGWCLTATPYVVPYLDGSLGPGHTWTGTAHASASTRATAALTYSSVSLPRSGTAMAWVNSAALVSANGNRRHILDHSSAGGVVTVRVNDALTCYVGGSIRANYALTDESFPPNTWHHVAMTWDEQAAETRLYLNGQQVGTTGGYAVPTDDGGGLDVGHSAGSYQWPGWIDEVVWCDRALSPDEIRAIYESNAPLQVGLWGPGFLGPARTPSSTAPGQPGEVAWDGNYIYICTAPNTWRRAALSAF